MTIADIVKGFRATPFLFIGSGLSRRYLGLPDWRGLLEHFAREIDANEFVYAQYESKAKEYECKYGILPKAAELIQKDYDNKWYVDSSIRHIDEHGAQMVHDGVSPFKIEVAAYLKSIAKEQEAYADEIQNLREISDKSISGVITTNYDTFLEDNLRGFKAYCGQSQLLFAPLQGVAEIYKIHGSVEQPDSLVLTEKDYKEFDEKSAYLIAKLMTVFVEYPIIFLGYSINDPNIMKIIREVVDCLDDKQLETLQNRFIFVKYDETAVGAEVGFYDIIEGERPVCAREIVLSDFNLLYTELQNKKSKMPVRLLRWCKQEVYDYVITQKTTATIQVAELEDDRISDDDLAIAIGPKSDPSVRGLIGISANDWYRNIILSDLPFADEELLQHALPSIAKQNSQRIPIHKYVNGATTPTPLALEMADKATFDEIISNSIKKNRNCLKGYTSVKQIWENEKNNKQKAYRLMAHLTEEQINVNELEAVLQETFNENKDVLDEAKPSDRTNIRRLIRIYDYLKWGNAKEPFN